MKWGFRIPIFLLELSGHDEFMQSVRKTIDNPSAQKFTEKFLVSDECKQFPIFFPSHSKRLHICRRQKHSHFLNACQYEFFKPNGK